MRELKKLALEANKEESEKSAMAKKVYESYNKFAAGLQPWHIMSDAAYHNLIAG